MPAKKKYSVYVHLWPKEDRVLQRPSSDSRYIIAETAVAQAGDLFRTKDKKKAVILLVVRTEDLTTVQAYANKGQMVVLASNPTTIDSIQKAISEGIKSWAQSQKAAQS